MKKLIAVTFAVILTAMLCGCAEASPGSAAENSGASVVESVSSEASSSISTRWTPVEVENGDVSCEAFALTALNNGSFPEMVKVTDSTLLSMIMDFSKHGITDYSVYQQAISVELSEVIVVRADDVDGVYDALMARKSSLIKQFGTYPEQEKVVSQTVVFKKGDLCVLIAADEPMTAERAILDKLKTNTVSEG